MYYITSEQARSIHKTTIEVSDGGITNEVHFGQLESVLQNIQNDKYYPTFIDKLTHLFFVHVNSIALQMEIKDLPYL